MNYITNHAILSMYDHPYGEETDELLYGITLDVVEKQGKWKKIKTEYGYEGWILEELHNEIQQKEIWMEEFPRLVVTVPWLDILTHPSIHSKAIKTIPKGSLLFWMGEKQAGNWYCVRLCDGQYGWVRKEWVRFWEKGELLEKSSKKKNEWIRRQIIEDARQYQMTAYRWGGKTPYGVDCSGFCSIVYWMSGIIIYRDAQMREDFPVHPISKDRLEQGDLLYYPGHVALYLGNQSYIHASGSAAKVVINSLDPSKENYREDLAFPQFGSVF